MGKSRRAKGKSRSAYKSKNKSVEKSVDKSMDEAVDKPVSSLPVWNLKDLYPDIESAKRGIEPITKQIHDMKAKYQGKELTEQDVIDCLAIYEMIATRMTRVATYAFLRYAENLNDSEGVRFYSDSQEVLMNLTSQGMFFALAVNKIPDAKLDKYLQNPALSKYKSWFRDLRAKKKYQLSDKEEELIVLKKTTSTDAWVRLFDQTLATIKFYVGTTEHNNHQIFDLLSSSDQSTRKDAADAISKTLSDNISLFSLIINVLSKDKTIDDEIRKVPDVMSVRNLTNNIDDDVVYSLIEVVKENYKNISHRYFRIKAKLMGKDKLQFWDRSAPLPGSSRSFNWEEAKDIVLSAYKAFSPVMYDIGKKFFDNSWIDAQLRDGKYFGAFSHPASVDVHPYIFMNYSGGTRDVMTLAHELGHGIHQYLCRERGQLLSETPLTLAETASVFGEQLVFRSLLGMESDSEQKMLLLARKLEDMLNTCVRQVAFCSFEIGVHSKRKEGELSPEQICNIWYDTQKEALGDAFELRDDYKYYWAYIPHFIHSPFYVYSYAFGDCLVNSLYKTYQNGNIENFEAKYIDMLSAAGTLLHYDLVAPFGLDTRKKEFWQHGMDVISEFIDELETLC